MTERKFELSSGRIMEVDAGMRLTIRDEPSGVVLIETVLSPNDVWRLFGGGMVIASGEGGSDLERIGKQMVNDSVPVPRDVTGSRKDDEDLKVAKTWARKNHPGWEAYEPRRTNRGLVVVLRKWVES
jgi:hypothetical protein